MTNNDLNKLRKEKFEVCLVGLQIENGKYVLNQVEEADAGIVIKANKRFKGIYALLIMDNINDYMPNLSTGKFYVNLDGIHFTCELLKA